MPVLEHSKLQDIAELKQANLVLSYLSHGYIWMERDDKPVPKVLQWQCLAWSFFDNETCLLSFLVKTTMHPIRT